WDAAKLAVQDFRSHAPRFQGPNEQRNREILEPLRELARSRGVAMAQMAIAWVLARGDDIVPLIGARTRETLRESLGALAITLSPAELEALDRAFPEGVAAGARYGEPQMAHLDSERP
ncbi:aldo/keto reductase, partial [Acidiferrobacter sp.]